MLLQCVDAWITKGGWKFCSAFSEVNLLLHCSEPGRYSCLQEGLNKEQWATGACKTKSKVCSKRVNICGLTVVDVG